MALTPPATIAAQIVAAIDAISIPQDQPITDATKIQIWTIVVEKLYNDLKTNAAVAPGTFVSTGPFNPIGGVGGPLS